MVILWGRMEVALAAFMASTLVLLIALSVKKEFLVRIADDPAARALWVDISVLDAAVHSGAVCLDGSPPAYFWHPGSGSGAKNWIVFLEGGAWCFDHASCAKRAKTSLGSSDRMERQTPFFGILSNSPKTNPDFYNWNRVKLKYCDGASFAGNVTTSVTTSNDDGSIDQARGLMYRGQRIWTAVIEHLLINGMDKAEMALLGGCSAGGLAATLHCGSFKELLPRSTRVKCVNDGGFFLDAKDISGSPSIRSYFEDVVDLHNVRQNMPQACVAKHDAKCFFPQFAVSHISVPMFFVNSAYDVWQIQNILVPDSTDPDLEWYNCKFDLHSCSHSQLSALQDFRATLVDALEPVRATDQNGFFIDSCFTHCQMEGLTWNTNKVGNKTIMEAVGDWYFERAPNESTKSIDCPYPCNPACIAWTGWGHRS